MGRYIAVIRSLAGGPFINVAFGLTLIVGFFVAFGGGAGGARRSGHPASNPSTLRRPSLPMSEIAQSAETRLNGLIAQFRSIPENMVLPEAAVEFERIESSHLPNLQHGVR